MISIGFRLKLLLAMLAMVALCTVVMLKVSLQRVETANNRLFHKRVEEQLTYLPREQESRLGAVCQKAADFAARPQVQAALEGRETTRLYRLARQQLQRMLAEEFQKLAEEMEAEEYEQASRAMAENLGSWLEQVAKQLDIARQKPQSLPAPTSQQQDLNKQRLQWLYDRTVNDTRRSLAGQVRKMSGGFEAVGKENPALRPRNSASPPAARIFSDRKESVGKDQARTITASFLVFLGEQGEVLMPEARFGRMFDNPIRRQFRERLEEFVPQLVELERQGVGYLGLDEEGKGGLIELVCTPVEQEGGGRKIGTLVLGFPLSSQVEQTLNDFGDLMTGMWVDAHLHSRAINPTALTPLTAWLKEHVKGEQPTDVVDVLTLNGTPYRVFYSAMEGADGLPKAYKVGLYSWEEPLAVSKETRDQILMIGGIMGLGTMGISWLISLGLFRPVRRLYRATMRLREGDYDVRIPVRSNDELGRLSHAFNETAKELALKEKYRGLLNKVTDKAVADRLMSGDVALGGETRGMTVLFCDIRKFTEITQNMSPAETVGLLNEHMTVMTRVIHEHGGLVDKFVGDMIMAVFGATGEDPDAPGSAVDCARHMMQERQVLNMMRGTDINVGIGIATGEMLAGFLGSEDRLNFTVIGQGANLASRLCTVAGPMDILVDEATCEAAREGRSADPLPPMEIRGFSDLQAVYRLKHEPAVEPEPADSAISA